MAILRSPRWVQFSEPVWTGQTGGKRVVRWPRAVKESECWTGVDRIAGKHEDSAREVAMKGVVFLGDRKLELREFPDPTPGPRDVILEIKASGMCGSDLHNYRAPAQPGGAVAGGIKRQAGVIAGHEPCGIVAAVGAGVTGTAWGALRRVNLQGGETIAIFGQGPVGLSATQLAVVMGARVIAVDIAPERRKLAQEFGAHEVIDARSGDMV